MSRPQGHNAAGRIEWIGKANDLVGSRTRDFAACSIVTHRYSSWNFMFEKLERWWTMSKMISVNVSVSQLMVIKICSSLERRNRGFESHLRHGCSVCVCDYSVCVVLCSGPRSPTVCEKWLQNWIRGQGPEWAGKASAEKSCRCSTLNYVTIASYQFIFQFVINKLSYHSTLYSLRCWQRRKIKKC
jgi:hypothetical protein